VKFAAILMLLFPGTALWAQQSITDGITPPSIAPGAPAGSYSLSNFDNVNLFNGHLNFRLPLLAPSGRGEARATVMLPIERNWRVTAHYIYSPPTCNGQDPSSFSNPNCYGYEPSPNWWNPFPILYAESSLVSRGAGNTPLAQCSNGPVYQYSLTRLTFTAPDSTESELLDHLTGGAWRVNNSCVPAAYPRGQWFSSSGGSAATFYADPGGIYEGTSGSPTGASGYLFGRDGSRYRSDGGNITSWRDRNGNTVTYTYGGNGYVSSIVDSLGHNITFTYQTPGTSPDNETANYDLITYNGAGGVQRSIKTWWANLRNPNAATPTHLRTCTQGSWNCTSTVSWTPSTESVEATSQSTDFALAHYDQLFPNLQGSSQTVFNPIVATAVQLPDGRYYRLWYDDYGQISAVDLPTGGRIEWDYTRNGATSSGGAVPYDYQVMNKVIERRVYTQSGVASSLAERTTYSGGTVSHYGSADNSNLLAKEIHYFTPEQFIQNPIQYAGQLAGREYQTEYYSASGTLLKTIANTWQERPCNDGSPFPVDLPCISQMPDHSSLPDRDPRITTATTTLSDVSPNQVAQQTISYDWFNNQTDVSKKDYGSGAPGTTLLSDTSTTYFSSYANPPSQTSAPTALLRSLPQTVTVSDSGGQKSQTTFGYDESAMAMTCASPPQHDANYGTTVQTGRGNVTSVQQWLNTGGTITSRKTYEVSGNVSTATDPKSNQTTTTYDSTTCTFPTNIKNPLNQSTMMTWDIYLGKPSTMTDPNQFVTQWSYNDPALLDRLTQVTRASTVQTTYAYDPTMGANKLTATTDVSSYGDNLKKTVTVYDGLGRTVEADEYVPTTQCSTGYVATTTFYDLLQRVQQVSNPYCASTESPVYTATAYDALNRVMSVTHPDSSMDSMSPINNQTTITDPSSVKRLIQNDAAGRTTSVTEYPAVGGPWVTSYTYDGLDNLTGVNQSGQTRSFVYDSLKRLTSATNPETSANGAQSGTISYAYDANSNLTQKTNARGVMVCFGNITGGVCDNSGYDVLNRPVLQSYSGTTPATPTVQWNWGTAVPNIGRLLSVSSTASTTTLNNYDALGRPGSSSQATPTGTTAYNFSYSYKPIGLSSVTYPSGRTISYCYDTAHCYDIDGRPTAVTGTLSGATTYYANSALYASHGGIQQLTLGSTANNIQQACYNSRFQTIGIRLGSSATTSCANSGSDLLNLSYGYGTTNNNGNLQTQTIKRYLQGVTQQWSQAYGYTDGVNRLTSASESGTGSWSENFGYDTYGNRWVTTPYVGLPGLTNETPQGPNWYLTKNQISGWVYDGAGNINSISGLSRSYSYDAENRLTKAITDTSNPAATTSTYSYDGDGRRVQKATPSGTTTFVYDAAGQLAAEYSTVPNTLSGPEYLTADHLGSTRLVTDASGNPTKCYDYLPFGEEIPNGYGGRTASCFGPASYPSAPDVVSEKFTGKERDAETGLDFFGARYFSAAQGRFTSPDWSEKPEPVPYASLNDPQTLNQYAYVRNNPLSLVDPDGHNCKADAGGDTNKWLTCNGVVPQITGYTLKVVKDTVVGAGKEAANAVIGLANSTNKAVNAGLSLTGTKFQFEPIKEFEGSTPGERSAMAGVFIVSLFTGAGEETAAAKIDRLTAEAEELYPKLAGKLNDHHIIPKYLGGAKNGATSRIPAAYHQLITNEFRRLAPYGQNAPTGDALIEVLKAVYSTYPLP
jgi:RHS repeat-associated protein